MSPSQVFFLNKQSRLVTTGVKNVKKKPFRGTHYIAVTKNEKSTFF